MRERPERDVYVASAWHRHATLPKSRNSGNRAQRSGLKAALLRKS
jgi:hypothetical protein